MTSCIYKFTSKTSGKSYIGQTKQLPSARKSAHLAGAFNENNKSYNSKFYRAIRKYGKEDFDYEVLCECNNGNLNEMECKFIEQFDSYSNGYNETTGGDAPDHVSKESNMRRSATHKKRFENMDEIGLKNWSEMLKKRHKIKPMTAETRKKISESVKKAWRSNRSVFLIRQKGQKKQDNGTLHFDYVRVRKRKVGTSYIIQNHPMCKHKSFSNMKDCLIYLIKLDIDKCKKLLEDLLIRQQEISRQIDSIRQMIINLSEEVFRD